MDKKYPQEFTKNKVLKDEVDFIKGKKAAENPPSLNNIPKQNNPQSYI